jgi:hypothetical protein
LLRSFALSGRNDYFIIFRFSLIIYHFNMVRLFYLLISALVLCMTIALVWGMMLKPEQQLIKTTVVNKSPEQIWQLISNHDAELSWRTDLKKNIRMPDVAGNEVWNEIQTDGYGAQWRDVVRTPNQKLERWLHNSPNYSASWRVELEPAATNQTNVKITEFTDYHNPLLCFIDRKIHDPMMRIDNYFNMLNK